MVPKYLNLDFEKERTILENDTAPGKAEADSSANHPEILEGRGKPPSKPSPAEKTEEGASDREYERRVLELADQKRRLLEKYPAAPVVRQEHETSGSQKGYGPGRLALSSLQKQYRRVGRSRLGSGAAFAAYSG